MRHVTSRAGTGLAACLVLTASFAAGCARSTPVDMADEGAPADEQISETGNKPPHGSGAGGQSLWSDLAHLALQTGMGFVHH